MAIIKRHELPEQRLILDLDGPDGNAWVLLGYAKRLHADLDLDVPYAQIRDEMKASDYNNLVNVFDKYFGEAVLLVRGD
jgi:hypothetical protein